MVHVREKVEFIPFFSRFMFQALFGLISGIAIDYIFERFKNYFDEKVRKEILLGLAFLQLFISFLFLFFIINILPINVHKYWQNTISGLAFPALYYGTQSTMFDNIKSIYRDL